jgi:H+/Cl- antiporter ClcA
MGGLSAPKVSALPKGILTEYRVELSSLLFLLFMFATVVGIAGIFLDEGSSSSLSFLRDLTDPFGSWVYWLIIIGPLGLIVAVWWLYDFMKKTRKLADLLKTPSKARFVRNLDDIEYLAWSLPMKYEQEVLKKKKEFGL